MIVAIALAGIVCSLWCFAKPRALATATPNRSVGEGVTLSVIVPARNEAGNLTELLRSLLNSAEAPYEIIVVDDESTDDTGSISRSFGVRVIEAPPLPNGWIGKTWACHTGAAAAYGTHLLFLDADTRLEPDALGQLLAVSFAHRGLVSVQPFHRTVRGYEELSAVFNAVAVFGSGCFGVLRAETGKVAFGPCLLMSRVDYDCVGGHAAVKGDVVEDLALASRFHAADLPVTCWLGGRAISYRMYPDGVRSLAEGWRKNIALGARMAQATAVAPAVAWVMSLAAVAAAGIAALIGWIGGSKAPLVPGIAWCLAAANVWWALRRLGRFRLVTSLLFVIPLATFVVVFASSALAAARGASVPWRGRRVPTRSVPSD